MTLNDVTKGAVDVWAKAARLPLHAVGTVVKPAEAEAWAPALVLDQAEAAVRGFLGGVLHDDALTTQAEIQRARVAELKRAVEAKAQAAATQELAEQRLVEREREVRAERNEVEQRAARAKNAVEQEKARADRHVDQVAATKKQTVRKVAAAREEGIESRAALAERRRLNLEAAALEQQREAVQAEGEALRVEDAVEHVKAKRSS